MRQTHVITERKPRITYQATTLVWIEVKGEQPPEEEQRRHPYPLARRDGGLVQRLQRFMDENRIFRAIPSGHSGAGGYAGGFYEPHAEQIISFLKKEGCKKTKQK